MKKIIFLKAVVKFLISYFLTTLRLIVVSYIALPLTFVTLVALNASDREGVASVKRRGGVVNFVHFERKYHRFLLNYFTLSCILISPHCLHGFFFSVFVSLPPRHLECLPRPSQLRKNRSPTNLEPQTLAVPSNYFSPPQNRSNSRWRAASVTSAARSR